MNPDEQKICTLEQRIVASALAMENENREFPADIKSVIHAPVENFCDTTCANIASAIRRASNNGRPPPIGEVIRFLDEAHRSFAFKWAGEGLPFSLVEVDAKDLLNAREARSVTQTLEEAARAAKENPAKANTIARNAVAALQFVSADEISNSKRHWPKPLAEDAFIGFFGEFVRRVQEHTEADPAAILFQMLICFGNCVNKSPFYRQEWTEHNAREFVLIVGKSAKARKGTSWNIVRAVFCLADKNWTTKQIKSGLGSGEGVVNAVRDEQARRDDAGNEIKIIGADDKRLMVVESEFASILSVSGREGSTLSEVLRNAWDSGNIQTLTKNNPLCATGAHISIIGHVTETELRAKMKEVAIANGFGNRFLICCAKRARLLPEGGNLSDEDFENLASELRRVIDSARKVSRMMRDDEARKLWCEVYPKLTSDRPGDYGAMTSRAEAHVLRLSMLYALADGKSEISLAHLKAALECWRYSQDSALYLWGDFSTVGLAAKIKDALADAGQSGLTKTQLANTLGHTTADDYNPALEKLIANGEVIETSKPVGRAGGRPVKIYRLR